MATIETRINETTGEEEIIIKDISNDLNGLIDEINKFRSKEKQNNPNSDKTEKIFITESLDFYEQTIDLEINFSDCVFEKKVKLYNCTFLHRAYLDNTTFEDLVDFYGCTFKEPQQFYKTDFDKVAIFSNATFEQEAQFIYCTTTSSSYISFQSAKFKMGIDVARANFNCKVSCWDMQVEDEGLREAVNSEYYLTDFNFEWLKKIAEKHIPNRIKDNKKLKEYIFKTNSKILSEIRNCITSWEKKEFDTNINIEQSKWTSASKKLRESMRFIKNNFYAENNRIEGSQFEKKELEIYRKEVKSQPNRFTKQLTSNNEPSTQWEKWLKYYDTSIFLQIFSLLLIGLMLFLYIIYTHYLFYGATLLFFIITMGSHLICKERTIKKSIKQNNYIPYILILASICLYFIALYDIHHIKNNYNSIIVYITFLAIFIAFGFTYLFFNEDKILLFLNKNSNDFGVSWIVGVNFTILVGLITYLPILGYLYQNNCISFDLSINGLGNFFQNFGEILNPLKWTNLCLFNTEPTGWIYVWIFIGRIFIGYGYYQTIQAFRKYGKS